LAGAVLLSTPRAARPLPLFSRSLGTSCTTCHDAVPHLNAAGIAFAQRGYLLDAHGADAAARARGVPRSVVGSARRSGLRPEPERRAARAAPGRETDAFSSFEIVAAGRPAAWLSGHADAGVSRNGVDAKDGQDFLQWNDLLPAGALTLKAGRFDAELP